MNNLAQSLRDAADALEAAQAPIAPKPPRTVSLMAKNVQNGDHVNFEGHGWSEVNSHVCYTDSNRVLMVSVGTGGAVHPFPGNERVQVRRYL